MSSKSTWSSEHPGRCARHALESWSEGCETAHPIRHRSRCSSAKEAALNHPALGSVNSVSDGSSRKVSLSGEYSGESPVDSRAMNQIHGRPNRRQRMCSRKLARLGSRRCLEAAPRSTFSHPLEGRAGCFFK